MNRLQIEKPRPLHLMTLNIHKGFASLRSRLVLQRIREAVRQVGADLVLLQEVLGEHRGHAARFHNWPSAPQYEYLADTIWSHHSYGKNAAFIDGHHGNALLSKYPILQERNHDISFADKEPRGVLHCTLDLRRCNKNPVHVMCVHLGLSTAERQRQLLDLKKTIENCVPVDAPLIVAGDFNDWRGRQVEKVLLSTGLKDAYRECNGKLARSFPAWLPLLPLDRIYSRNVEVSNTQLLQGQPWRGLSDHLALLAEVEI